MPTLSDALGNSSIVTRLKSLLGLKDAPVDETDLDNLGVYTKPQTGIPSSDLDAAVTTEINKIPAVDTNLRSLFEQVFGKASFTAITSNDKIAVQHLPDEALQSGIGGYDGDANKPTVANGVQVARPVDIPSGRSWHVMSWVKQNAALAVADDTQPTGFAGDVQRTMRPPAPSIDDGPITAVAGDGYIDITFDHVEGIDGIWALANNAGSGIYPAYDYGTFDFPATIAYSSTTDNGNGTRTVRVPVANGDEWWVKIMFVPAEWIAGQDPRAVGFASPWSAEVSEIPTAPPTVVNPPTGLSVSGGSGSDWVLTWNDPAVIGDSVRVGLVRSTDGVNYSNELNSVLIGVETMTIPEANLDVGDFVAVVSSDGSWPPTGGTTVSTRSNAVELTAGEAWLDTFTGPDATLITAHTPEAGGAYDAGTAGGSVLSILSGQLRSTHNNDVWATVADSATGQINRVRALVPNNTGSTTHQVAALIYAAANTNGLDAYGARVNYLNGSFEIVQLSDGAISVLAGGSGGYTGDDGNAFWQEIEYYLDANNSNAPTLTARIIDATSGNILGSVSHVLGGPLSSGDAGLWMTNAAGRIDEVRGYN